MPDALRGSPFTHLQARGLDSVRKGLPVAEALKAFPIALLLNTGRL
ncbi:MAG: hypothetical protein Q8P48_08985 [Deltaproteobacteria bacterium]|nr:hypothetical protein [Deltaproteobacteria bacterium]